MISQVPPLRKTFVARITSELFGCVALVLDVGKGVLLIFVRSGAYFTYEPLRGILVDET